MAGSDEDRTIRTLLVILLVVIVAVPILMLVSMGLTGWDNDGYGMMGSWGGGWGLMMAIPGAVILIVILAIVLAALSDRPAGQNRAAVPYPPQFYPPAVPLSGTSSDSMAILDRRLASGEVTVEEYGRIKNELLRH
jgi:uncharacterized membrane protein